MVILYLFSIIFVYIKIYLKFAILPLNAIILDNPLFKISGYTNSILINHIIN
jgi:hypothetical protein